VKAAHERGPSATIRAVCRGSTRIPSGQKPPIQPDWLLDSRRWTTAVCSSSPARSVPARRSIPAPAVRPSSARWGH